MIVPMVIESTKLQICKLTRKKLRVFDGIWNHDLFHGAAVPYKLSHTLIGGQSVQFILNHERNET